MSAPCFCGEVVLSSRQWMVVRTFLSGDRDKDTIGVWASGLVLRRPTNDIPCSEPEFVDLRDKLVLGPHLYWCSKHECLAGSK